MVLVLVVAVLAGVWLIVTGFTRGRLDPVDRALAGHPLAARRARRRHGRRLVTRWEQWVGVHQRADALHTLGRDLSSHRRRQRIGAGVGTGIAALLLLMSGVSALSATWAVATVVLSVWLVDLELRQRAIRRRQVLSGQVVELAEFLALGTTAGLTAAEAFDKSARFVGQPLHSWLAGLSADVRSGRSLDQAATAVAALMGVPAFTRLVDAVVTATDRGTPLAATLVAQAADCRSQAQATELERAGRAEIAMLVPIVFLVLPAVVAVAVYPGFVALTSM